MTDVLASCSHPTPVGGPACECFAPRTGGTQDRACECSHRAREMPQKTRSFPCLHQGAPLCPLMPLTDAFSPSSLGAASISTAVPHRSL